MPIAAIAILVLAVLGVGAYFFTSDSQPAATEPTATETARTDVETPNDEPVQDAEISGDGDDDSMLDIKADVDTSADMMSSSMPDAETAAATPYSSEQTYLTPARTAHDMDINLTIADDGTIVGANIVYDNNDGFSNAHQQRFDGAYQSAIIGQNISDAELAVTGGASLTTEAFNDAIADIRAQQS